MLVNVYKVWRRLLSKKVFPGRVEFWRIKNILQKMTAVASLSDVWDMVDHELPMHTAAEITKVKDLALIFRSVSFTQ